MRGFLFILSVLLFAPAPVPAQGKPVFPGGEIVLPYAPPVEPDLPAVKFIKQDPPGNLTERVDRLLHGIKTDIPPRYDAYGYELRRYMAHITGDKVLADPKRLQEELGNLAKAKIVLQYWRQELFAEMGAIEKELDTQAASPTLRSTFKYNQGIVNAFMAECQNWIEANEKMLTFLSERDGLYGYNKAEFVFGDVDDQIKFANRFQAAETARVTINKYMPFMGMIY